MIFQHLYEQKWIKNKKQILGIPRIFLFKHSFLGFCLRKKAFSIYSIRIFRFSTFRYVRSIYTCNLYQFHGRVNQSNITRTKRTSDPSDEVRGYSWLEYSIHGYTCYKYHVFHVVIYGGFVYSCCLCADCSANKSFSTASSRCTIRSCRYERIYTCIFCIIFKDARYSNGSALSETFSSSLRSVPLCITGKSLLTVIRLDGACIKRPFTRSLSSTD